MSEAAHRTPPGKDADGTEINPSPCKVAFSAVDIIFFIVLMELKILLAVSPDRLHSPLKYELHAFYRCK